MKDRFGIGWRSELSASIMLNLDKIDIVEVIAEKFPVKSKAAKALKTLIAQVPVTIHSVSLGLASSIRVDVKRIERLARLIDLVQPESWSEHLAFVRAGEFEIGHLAAAPRNLETIEGAVSNISIARNMTGMLPAMENIATLVNPPASTMSEPQWISQILMQTGSDFLLDLHNMYANALNFGIYPDDFLNELPLNKVTTVHLSGGKWINNPDDINKKHLLDDHLHDVPKEVYSLLSTLAEKCNNPLTILIERDGYYPSFDSILEQVQKARDAVAFGRNRKNHINTLNEVMHVCA